ncbi:MAG: hypothetical protein RJA44_1328, partial [Pseudomonadota bacterium]
MNNDLWERGCERLAAELPEQQFNTWIRPLPPAEVSVADGLLLVGLRVPNRFKLDWIRSQYGARIEHLLSEIAGMPVRLELSLLSRDATTRVGATVRTPPARPQPAAAAVALPPLPAIAAAAPAVPAALQMPRPARRSTRTEAVPVQALLLPELALPERAAAVAKPTAVRPPAKRSRV